MVNITLFTESIFLEKMTPGFTIPESMDGKKYFQEEDTGTIKHKLQYIEFKTRLFSRVFLWNLFPEKLIKSGFNL